MGNNKEDKGDFVDDIGGRGRLVFSDEGFVVDKSETLLVALLPFVLSVVAAPPGEAEFRRRKNSPRLP